MGQLPMSRPWEKNPALSISRSKSVTGCRKGLFSNVIFKDHPLWEDGIQGCYPLLVGPQIGLQLLAPLKRRFQLFCLFRSKMLVLYCSTFPVSQAGVDVFLAVALHFSLPERPFRQLV